MKIEDQREKHFNKFEDLANGSVFIVEPYYDYYIKTSSTSAFNLNECELKLINKTDKVTVLDAKLIIM